MIHIQFRAAIDPMGRFFGETDYERTFVAAKPSVAELFSRPPKSAAERFLYLNYAHHRALLTHLERARGADEESMAWEIRTALHQPT